MADPRLIKLIRRLREIHSDEEIRKQLKASGRSDGDIGRAFSEVNHPDQAPDDAKQAKPPIDFYKPLGETHPRHTPVPESRPAPPEPLKAPEPKPEKTKPGKTKEPLDLDKPLGGGEASPVEVEPVDLNRPTAGDVISKAERAKIKVKRGTTLESIGTKENAAYAAGGLLAFVVMAFVLRPASYTREGMGAGAEIDITIAEPAESRGLLSQSKRQEVFLLAQQGDKEAQYALGVHHFFFARTSMGPRAETDAHYRLALQWLGTASENAVPDAKYRYGVMLRDGYGVQMDEQRGRGLIREAAAAGSPPAQTAIGIDLLSGRGVTRDEGEAVKWLEKAAGKEDPDALYELARLLETGRGAGKNTMRAKELLRRAAELGNPEALLRIGELYEEGRIYKKDLSAARAWYQKAAELGEMMAQYRLGEMYRKGEGVWANPRLAALRYRDAAAQGYGPALRELGRMYAEGEGVRHDPAEAYYWYYLAVRHGVPEAQEPLKKLRTRLSPRKAEFTEERARAFRPTPKRL